MKIDFHVHTEYSNDGCMKLEDIKKVLAEKRIVDAIAITDHNEIEGALKLKEVFKDNIIVGEEIDTGEGEIIGYWLNERIKPEQGIKKTLEHIKKQGGYSCIPHLFDKVRSKHADIVILNRFVDEIDMIEVFNSRNLFKGSNEDAKQFAIKNNLLAIVGSDAHYKKEIGNAYLDCDTGLKSVGSPKDVLYAIKSAILKGKKCNIKYHIMTKMLKIRNRQ